MIENPLIVLLGPTASGKTSLAVKLAHKIGGEIISADSRQVYSGMNIGTGKDLQEYNYKGVKIPYHLIDILPAGDRYNLHKFKTDFERVYKEVRSRGRMPILCGGTGLYIQQVLQPDPYTVVPVDQILRDQLSDLTKEDLIEKINELNGFEMRVDKTSSKRMIRALEIAAFVQHSKLPVKTSVDYDASVFGLEIERPVLRSRIQKRLDQRFDQGMIEEARGLISANVSTEMLQYYGLEYKFLSLYISGFLPLEIMRERLFNSIAQYAKRQVTFFKKMQKDGVNIHWLNGRQDNEKLVTEILDNVSARFTLTLNN